MSKNLDFFNVPTEHQTAIGMVAIRWNYLDYIFNLVLIHITGLNIHRDASHIIFAHMAFPQKLDVISSYCEIAVAGGGARFSFYKSDVQPLLKKAQSGRNMMLHSVWGMKDGEIRRASLTARGKFRFVWEEVPFGKDCGRSGRHKSCHTISCNAVPTSNGKRLPTDRTVRKVLSCKN